MNLFMSFSKDPSIYLFFRRLCEAWKFPTRSPPLQRLLLCPEPMLAAFDVLSSRPLLLSVQQRYRKGNPFMAMSSRALRLIQLVFLTSELSVAHSSFTYTQSFINSNCTGSEYFTNDEFNSG